jgi:RHS repeat-associated protein
MTAARLTKGERYDDSETLLTRYTYTYDLADNMTTKEVYTPPSTTVTTTFAYTSANELTSSTTGGTTTNYAFDDWGHMTGKTQGGSGATYYWNYGDKLTKVSSNFAGEGTVTYVVGADGKRRQRDDGTTVTNYKWDEGRHVVNEENSGGTLTTTYVHGPGELLADIAGSNPSTGTYRHYCTDNLGSTRRLRDADKDSLAQYEYEPYGTVYAHSGADTDHQFAGLEWDEAAQLHRASYRYYNPGTSRWLGRDPMGMSEGPNVYAYADSNPVNRMDPVGTESYCGACLGKQRTIHNNVAKHCDLIDTFVKTPSLAECMKARCRSRGELVKCGGAVCLSPGVLGFSPMEFVAQMRDALNGVQQYDSGLAPISFPPGRPHMITICVRNHVMAASANLLRGASLDSVLGATVVHEWAHGCGWLHSDDDRRPVDYVSPDTIPGDPGVSDSQFAWY